MSLNLLALGLACLSCTRLNPAERIVRLEEPAAGMVSRIVTAVLGSQDRIDALTLPDGTIVTLVKDPSPCLIAHEQVHQEQLSRYGWHAMTVIYVEEVREVGYRNVSFEKEAYARQAECVARMEASAMNSTHERFYEKTIPEPNSGCLLWLGTCSGSQGHGQFRLNGRTDGAHRAAWVIERGPIPEGMLVCHKCDTPCCVNVDHLFLGTQRDNMADCKAKGRARGKSRPGESHPRAKHTQSQVDALRAAYRAGEEPLPLLASRYGFNYYTAWEIVRGKSWNEVTP